MTDYIHQNAYWHWHTHTAGAMDVSRYLKMLEIFIETGEIAGRGVAWPEDQPWLKYEDPLLKYLIKLMADPEVKYLVLSNRLCAKIFYASVGRFVVEAVHHKDFLAQCQWTERKKGEDTLAWSAGMRQDEQSWRKLIQQIEQEHDEDGFDGGFYLRIMADGGSMDDEKWAKMVDDWGLALDQRLQRDTEKYVRSRGSNLGSKVAVQMKNAQETLERKNVQENKAVQAWQLMNGRWTETEFERHMSLIRLQDKYPQLEDIVKLMGRFPNTGGKDRLTMTAGRGMKIDHSTGSDIEGITVGNDISTLLPLEMAQYMDDDLEEVFLYKFVRRRLQTFRYKSNMSKPSRKLSFNHASRKGPMIVCVDTSASMYGPPQRIIQSLLAMLEETAEEQKRDCFLIDFSVSVRTIDLMQRRKQQLYESIGLTKDEYTFDKGHLPFIGGGTDAKNMMAQTFSLLDHEGQHYVNADVLWISDFLIPMPERTYLDKMRGYRQTGTRFYGLQIMPEGTKSEDWTPLFDRIYHIDFRILRKY